MTKFEAIATELKSVDRSDLLLSNPEIARSAQVGFNPETLVPKPTYVEAGIEKLTALCKAVGLADKTAQAIEIFRAMTVSWGDRKIGADSSWQSDVSDDGSPFEFSIAFKGDRAELRILLEAQGTEPTIQSNWEAGLKLNQYLAEHFDVSLDRFRKIEDLFVPTNADAKLAIWHSVCFYPDQEPSFKIYLNPQAQEKSLAAAVVEESLVRLGFSHAWSNLAEIAAQRGPDKDEFPYFSLDLASDSKARVKVYLRHHDATSEDLEKALSLAQNYAPGDVTEFCQLMSDGQSLFSAKPVISCFSWVEGDDTKPSNGILHLPVSNYAPNDLVVRERLDRYFSQYDLPISLYHLAIQSLTARSLEAGVGMHSYTSLSLDRQQRRVTIYLNPEVITIRPSNNGLGSQVIKVLPSLEEMVYFYENNTIANHPFLRRIQREPVNTQRIWLIFMNIYKAFIPYFTRWLAHVIAQVEDDRIRAILAHQLNEELGNGNADRTHRKLFEKLMIGIDPWRMDSVTEDMLVPGAKFKQSLEEIYLDATPYVGLGSVILMEIQAKQFDLCLGQEFRKTSIELSKITWLVLHEELEVDHANEALIVARFADEAEEGLAATKGAQQARLESWRFFDRLYRLCFN